MTQKTGTVTGIRLTLGSGMSSPQFTASAKDDRMALVEQCLAQVSDGVLVLELQRDDRPWRTTEELEALDNEAYLAALAETEYLKVGVHGEAAAAEYVAPEAIVATDNPAGAGQPRVPYDECVPQYFPPETVVSVSEVRQLLHAFALHGTWPDSVASREHDSLVV